MTRGGTNYECNEILSHGIRQHCGSSRKSPNGTKLYQSLFVETKKRKLSLMCTSDENMVFCQ